LLRCAWIRPETCDELKAARSIGSVEQRGNVHFHGARSAPEALRYFTVAETVHETAEDFRLSRSECPARRGSFEASGDFVTESLSNHEDLAGGARANDVETVLATLPRDVEDFAPESVPLARERSSAGAVGAFDRICAHQERRVGHRIENLRKGRL
jgi:hypothetical protein